MEPTPKRTVWEFVIEVFYSKKALIRFYVYSFVLMMAFAFTSDFISVTLGAPAAFLLLLSVHDIRFIALFGILEWATAIYMISKCEEDKYLITSWILLFLFWLSYSFLWIKIHSFIRT